MRTRAFIKRNLLEMVRDPLIYIFCLGFPVLMLILFQIINKFTNGTTPMFEPKSLVSGVTVFSFAFVMMIESMLVSKDKTSAFLIRLYTSPMRTHEYVLGYTVPCLIVGVGQIVLCLFVGYIISLIVGAAYFSFGAAMLFAVAMLPALLTFIAFGVLFGSLLNDKAAPGICSAVICAAGVLGGAWMPLEIMGGFETFCRCLPFYPSVYLGRVITGANKAVTDPVTGAPIAYAFDTAAKLGFIPIVLFLVAGVVFALLAFKRNMRNDKR